MNKTLDIVGFTSLLESSFGKMPVTSGSLLSGMRIKYESRWYLVGQACKLLGRNPHRVVNARPNEIDYQVLFLSSLLHAGRGISETIRISLGFPFSTFNHYKPFLEKHLTKKSFMIEYDASTFKKEGIVEKKYVEIENYEIIPELVACVIGLKKHYKAPERNFLIISLGFGTVEIGIVNEEGLNKRTVISIPGIVQCIKSLRDELERENFLGFITDNQLDESLIKGSVVINRNNVNISSLRSNILSAYYKEYISDTIRSMVSDRDFGIIEKIYVCGGGVHYKDLQDAFTEEFEKVVPVEFVAEPDVLAATGYYYNAERLESNAGSKPVGIDLGNSSTYVILEKSE